METCNQRVNLIRESHHPYRSRMSTVLCRKEYYNCTNEEYETKRPALLNPRY